MLRWICLLSLLSPFVGALSAPQAVQAPQLKWAYGGCYSSWCETGWYSSPAVADLDGDGTPEILGGGYTLFALNGEDGSEQWSVAPPVDGARVWPGVVVADLDNDLDLEIVTAHGSGYLRVLDHSGAPVWQQRPVSNELRGLAVYDLDNDGTLEIVTTAAIGDSTNTWVYEHDSALRPGWPRRGTQPGYSAGVFNDNAAVADLDGDDQGEIVVPSDMHYICAYEADGAPIPTNAIYGGKVWGEVGIWEDLAIELRGWGDCSSSRAERYRTNFAHGPAAIADLNGDATKEVVAVGNVYDCAQGHPPGMYNGVYVFNADRSRFQSGSYDWQQAPVDTGAPLSENYSVIESNQPNPVIADLDGDGESEILYSSYDGRVHAFWLDKTEHANWPYSVYNAAEGFLRFSSEPVVADLDADGQAEVLFSSWTQKGSDSYGKLHILDAQGNLLHAVDLPAPRSGSVTWNGALPAPTLANVDADADLEIVLNTAYAGLVVYDLPGTAQARVHWGTARGNQQRTGEPPVIRGSLFESHVTLSEAHPQPNTLVTFTISLQNSGLPLESVYLTNTLPAEMTPLYNASASSGTVDESGAVLTWHGEVVSAVNITFGARVSSTVSGPTILSNLTQSVDEWGQTWQEVSTLSVNAKLIYLPVTLKQ